MASAIVEPKRKCVNESETALAGNAHLNVCLDPPVLGAKISCVESMSASSLIS